jgi:hypothetical protein
MFVSRYQAKKMLKSIKSFLCGTVMVFLGLVVYPDIVMSTTIRGSFTGVIDISGIPSVIESGDTVAVAFTYALTPDSKPNDDNIGLYKIKDGSYSLSIDTKHGERFGWIFDAPFSINLRNDFQIKNELFLDEFLFSFEKKPVLQPTIFETVSTLFNFNEFANPHSPMLLQSDLLPSFTDDLNFGNNVKMAGSIVAGWSGDKSNDQFFISFNIDSESFELGSAPVPEPGTIFLFGIGLFGVLGFGRKKFIKK